MSPLQVLHQVIDKKTDLGSQVALRRENRMDRDLG